MQLDTSRNGSRPVCRVRGELDATSATRLADVLASFVDAGDHEIDLDLRDAEFTDCEGVNVLLRAHFAGLRIAISAASPSIRRAFEMIDIETLLFEKASRRI